MREQSSVNVPFLASEFRKIGKGWWPILFGVSVKDCEAHGEQIIEQLECEGYAEI